MAGKWQGSQRKDELPSNWRELCRIIHDRSGRRCEFILPSGNRCPRRADGGVDHIQRGNDHRIENLRDSCQTHHGRKSSEEGAEAKALIQRQRFRAPEGHPGDRR